MVLPALLCLVVLWVGYSAPTFAQELRVSLGGGTFTSTALRPGTTITAVTNIEFADIVVGNPDIADVVPLSSRSLYIQGKKNGFTNLAIYDAERNLLGIIEVRVQQDSRDVASAIRAAVPGAKIRVSNVGNRIRLSGAVANAVDQQKVIAVARQFSAEPVINALSVGGAQQVSLEVRVLEAKRSFGEDLGVNMVASGGTSLLGTGSRVSINVDNDPASPTWQTPQPFLGVGGSPGTNQQGIPFGTLVANVLSTGGVSIDVIIDALEKKGLARRLAQPNLTTISGETASFHAGGEVPISTAVASGGGVASSVDYRPYGVVVEFVPTALEGSKINLRVHTEVSEIDRTVNVNGNPGFTSRSADTVLELRDGQSFALAGLLQAINETDIEQVPWLGQVPILGALFRSTSYRKQETDLVIVVTPRLVRPAEPGEDLHSPLDQTLPANDFQLFALGLLEVDKNMIRKFRTGEGIVGPYGHRIDLEFGDGYAVKK
jgi:pilus assembly protein CpaC